MRLSVAIRDGAHTSSHRLFEREAESVELGQDAPPAALASIVAHIRGLTDNALYTRLPPVQQAGLAAQMSPVLSAFSALDLDTVDRQVWHQCLAEACDAWISLRVALPGAIATDLPAPAAATRSPTAGKEARARHRGRVPVHAQPRRRRGGAAAQSLRGRDGLDVRSQGRQAIRGLPPATARRTREDVFPCVQAARRTAGRAADELEPAQRCSIGAFSTCEVENRPVIRAPRTRRRNGQVWAEHMTKRRDTVLVCSFFEPLRRKYTRA